MSKWKLTTGTNEVHEEWVKGDIVFRKVTSLKSYIWYIYTSDENIKATKQLRELTTSEKNKSILDPLEIDISAEPDF